MRRPPEIRLRTRKFVSHQFERRVKASEQNSTTQLPKHIQLFEMRLSPFSLHRSSLATISRSHRATIASAHQRRWYSIHADHAAVQLQDIDPTKLSITKTTTPKELTRPEDLVFGKYFTGTCAPARQSPAGQCLDLTNLRPYALDGMDSYRRMATATNNSLPKSIPRPCNLCLPLCF